jgi:carbohydrate kinase (thermoresistant glucokinase family)
MAGPVIYIIGVSGSGKTTIGTHLSAFIGIPFFDADDFHSKANKEKMQEGSALTDEDRADWLQSLNQLAIVEIKKKGAIIACSALKRKYREILASGLKESVYWVFLHGDYKLIEERMKARKDHFMPDTLLHSQFEILEPPEQALMIDVLNNTDDIVRDIVHKLNL